MTKEEKIKKLTQFCAIQYDCYDCALLVGKNSKFYCEWQDNAKSIDECYEKINGKLIKERKDKENDCK